MTDTIEARYEAHQKNVRNLTRAGFAAIGITIAGSILGHMWITVVGIVAFIALWLAGLVATLKFWKVFKTYWASTGMNDAAIKAKWNAIYPAGGD